MHSKTKRRIVCCHSSDKRRALALHSGEPAVAPVRALGLLPSVMPEGSGARQILPFASRAAELQALAGGGLAPGNEPAVRSLQLAAADAVAVVRRPAAPNVDSFLLPPPAAEQACQPDRGAAGTQGLPQPPSLRHDVPAVGVPPPSTAPAQPVAAGALAASADTRARLEALLPGTVPAQPNAAASVPSLGDTRSKLVSLLGCNGGRGRALVWRPDDGLLAYAAANAIVLEQPGTGSQR